MLATVHIADRGLRGMRSWRRDAPARGSRAGLIDALVATPAPLGGGVLPRAQLGRLTLIAFWADADAAERGLAGTEWASPSFDGLSMQLEAVRMIGAWPGVDEELPSHPDTTHTDTTHDGAAAVITIGRLRLREARRFMVAGAAAERHVIASPGFTWGTGLASLERGTLLTLSWWHDQAAMVEMARGAGAHADAMAEQAERDFHHESAFIRFRPVEVRGSLGGRNPVDGLVA